MQEQKSRTINIDAVLQSWKLRLGLIGLLFSPVVAATGAYMNLRDEVHSSMAKVENTIDQKYVTKDAFKDLKDNVRETREDVKDLKRFLMDRSGK